MASSAPERLLKRPTTVRPVVRASPAELSLSGEVMWVLLPLEISVLKRSCDVADVLLGFGDWGRALVDWPPYHDVVSPRLNSLVWRSRALVVVSRMTLSTDAGA